MCVYSPSDWRGWDGRTAENRSWVQAGKHSKTHTHVLNKTKTNTRKAGILRFHETKMFYWVSSMHSFPPGSAFRQDKQDDSPVYEKWVRFCWLPPEYWFLLTSAVEKQPYPVSEITTLPSSVQSTVNTS